MTAIAQDRPATAPVTDPAPRPSLRHPAPPKVRRMTLERWRNWKSTDGWKYDWDNGIITKSKKMVAKEQRYITKNLLDAFYEKALNRRGTLMPESEMSYDAERYRVPDLGYFTRAQTTADAKGENARSIPAFAIEIISDNDIGKAIENKLWEYFENGVQVVWHILPFRKVVKVYTSPITATICVGDMACSPAPALPDFEMTANQIFHLEAE